MAWALEFGNLTGVSSMTMTAVTHGSQRLEHTSTEVVMVDRDYTAEIVHITTVDDATPLSTLTPIGSGVEHIALVNGSFSSDGMVATGGVSSTVFGSDVSVVLVPPGTTRPRIGFGEHNGTALIPWTVPVGFDGRVVDAGLGVIPTSQYTIHTAPEPSSRRVPLPGWSASSRHRWPRSI